MFDALRRTHRLLLLLVFLTGQALVQWHGYQTQNDSGHTTEAACVLCAASAQLQAALPAPSATLAGLSAPRFNPLISSTDQRVFRALPPRCARAPPLTRII